MRFANESRKAVVWLGALIAIFLSFQAASRLVEARPAHKAPRASATKTTALQLDTLAATIIPASNFLNDTAHPSEAKAAARVELPPVEEFILTPPNPAAKMDLTILGLRFAPAAAEHLPSSVQTTLGKQTVALHRSPDDPAIYVTPVDFNWEAFAEEQARRQVLADEGKQVPVFDGHRLRHWEQMQFVDPQQVRQALQSHESIHFTSQVLQGSPVNILPDHELLITNIGVAEDPLRTWDPCARRGTQMGAWTFGALMTAIANDNPATHLIADAMVQSWLDEWTIQQTVNNFPVSARIGMISVLRNWRQFAQDQNGNVDISQAPFQLNAIVNRIDLVSSSDPAGALRFVFGYAPCSGGEGVPATFNVIVEYHVPVLECTWATQWHNLDLQIVGTPAFSRALEAITDQVTPSGNLYLEQVRTNESFTSQFAIWEQRQFQLSSGALKEVALPQTPNGDTAAGRIDFNQETCNPGSNCQSGTLTDYINEFQQEILANNYTVPNDYPAPSDPFLGGSAFNGASIQALVFWQGNPPPNSNQARSIFSENTCNGCHGRETFTAFQQVQNRQPGPPSTAQPSVLSAFLVGCSTSSQNNPLTNQTGPCPAPPTNACNLQNTLTRNPACATWVQDPADPNTVNEFAELSRRAQILSTILQGCSADGVLQSLAVSRLSSPH